MARARRRYRNGHEDLWNRRRFGSYFSGGKSTCYCRRHRGYGHPCWDWILAGSPNHTGMTTEFTAIVCFLLGALCWTDARLAVSVASIIALLLESKEWTRKLVRDIVTGAEVIDAARWFVLAFVILPLIPDRSIGPNGLVNPARVWELVVLLTAVGWFGYIATRAVGEKPRFAGGWGDRRIHIGCGYHRKPCPALETERIRAHGRSWRIDIGQRVDMHSAGGARAPRRTVVRQTPPCADDRRHRRADSYRCCDRSFRVKAKHARSRDQTTS